MVSPSRRPLVDELAAFDRLLEVGVGNRPGVARALAARGRHVVAIDVVETVDAMDAAVDTDDTADTGATDGDRSGSLRLRQGDVVALADDPDPLATVLCGEDPDTDGKRPPSGIDAVYACNLPAELQRPTVALADRLDAACLFTTLGFEEPTVPVRRRSLPGETLFVARSGR